ncbi:hypothetical protein D3C72_2335030 [compost metagenome]
MGGIATKGHQRGTNIVPRRHCRMGIAEVIAEQIAPYRQVVVAGQLQQVPGQVVVVRPG